jgi:hypothetical protein
MLRWLRGVMAASSVPVRPSSNLHIGCSPHIAVACLGCKSHIHPGNMRQAPSDIATCRSWLPLLLPKGFHDVPYPVFVFKMNPHLSLIVGCVGFVVFHVGILP